MKIFLDPGHGGSNPGAVSDITGEKESEINLDTAVRTQRILEELGYTVKLSRTGETNLSLTERAEAANAWEADYFVSIHCNSSEDSAVTGSETFFYRKGSASEGFARMVQEQLIIQNGLNDLGIKSRNFAVLRLTKMPAVLTELGFLTNENDAELLSQPDFREKCAQGIANGVWMYINQI